MTRAAVVAFALMTTTGCLQGAVGPYVKEARVEGSYLVLTRCVIELRSNRMSEGRCHEERKLLRVSVTGAAMRRDVGGPPGAAMAESAADDGSGTGVVRSRGDAVESADEVARRALIARLRPVSRDLLACARQHGVHGRVVLTVVVVGQGAVAAVDVDRGPAELETCLRSVVQRADVSGLAARQYRVPLAFPAGGVR